MAAVIASFLASAAVLSQRGGSAVTVVCSLISNMRGYLKDVGGVSCFLSAADLKTKGGNAITAVYLSISGKTKRKR